MAIVTVGGEFAAEAVERFRRLRVHFAQMPTASNLWKLLRADQRRQLGSDLYDALRLHSNAIGMWMHLHTLDHVDAVIDLGEKFHYLTQLEADSLLREFGKLPRNPEDAQAEAIERGDFVLIRNPRSIFWDGKLIDADWYREGESWRFVVIAVEHAKRGEPIDRLSFGDHAYDDVVSKKKSRLKARVPGFPQDLLRAFRTIGTGTQQLTLPPSKIHLFDR